MTDSPSTQPFAEILHPHSDLGLRRDALALRLERAGSSKDLGAVAADCALPRQDAEHCARALQYLDLGLEPVSAPSHKRVTVGSVVADYELLEELGRGGMGVVFLARHAAGGQPVALKIQPRPDSERDRFSREVRAASRLHHPHIVSVHDAGIDGELAWIAMERIEGASLACLLQARGPLDPPQAVQLTLKLVQALDYAHRAGCLHRDLKPGNVLLDTAGEPRLVDFGLVKLLDEPAAGLTQTGQLLGTPDYMAPEQAASRKDLDIRTDVYGVGATLYALLTGHAPFARRAMIDTLLAVLQEPPPKPSARAPSPVPNSLDEIVVTCMAKAPQDRYQDMPALGRALAAWLARR